MTKDDLRFVSEAIAWNIKAFEAVDALIETGTLRQVATLGIKHNQLALERLEGYMKGKFKPPVKNQREDIEWLERLWELGDNDDS